MLEYNEVTERKYIILDDEPWEVLSSHVFRKQQRKPVNATKIRNLLTGRVTERSFASSDKVEEADISTRKIKYLYTNKGEYWFCEEKDPSKRFKLEEEMLGPQMRFLKPNSIVDALIFTDEDNEDDGGKIIGVKVPITADLKVTEAFNAVKGDTATGGSKTVTLETGTTINVPLFVKEGDVIRVNTESGEYRERVS
jgi:elongation factor P